MRKLNLIVLAATLITAQALAQNSTVTVKSTTVKATLKPANRKIHDPNVGIVRAPIPPANEHYKSTPPANKTVAPGVTQSAAPVKATTPLPVITTSQAKMTKAMTTPAKSVHSGTPAATVHSKYNGKKITSVKPGRAVSKRAIVKSKPKTLKPAVKKVQDNKARMFSSIYHH